ncbi:MAG TPA: hypothetical protein VF040_15755 [Ktedonobacterales bacterium]
MNNRPAVQSIGWNLGILSGLFAVLQVMISTSSARANIASIESMRLSLDRLQTGGGNPVPLVGSLLPVVLVTYTSIVVTGVVSLILSWYAGRLTAYVQGRRDGGAGAGFRVALLSGSIWIVFSVIVSLTLHADGTITGVLTSTRDGSSLPAQLTGLLVQEIVLAGIGLGLGAWAGYLGAGSARLPSDMPGGGSPAMPTAFYGMSPAHPQVAGYPVYHTNGSYPLPTPPYPYPAPAGSPQASPGNPPVYPPPPNYYRSAGTAATSGAERLEPQQPAQAPSPDAPASLPPAE